IKGQSEYQPLDSSDFEAMSNAVYDVDSMKNSGEVSSEDQLLDGPNKGAPFPKRMALKVEDGASDFKACGGFSGGGTGTCCTACMKLNYKTGCWCRTWDCLCFDA
ncbi:unnamed protein product, partial [Allacma fusca]